MRWDDLFRDLEAQLAAATAAELDAEVADRARREGAAPRTARPGAGGGGASGGGARAGRRAGRRRAAATSGRSGCSWPRPVGATSWCRSPRCVSLTGLRAWSGVPGEAGAVFARLGIGSALRGIARDRLPVQVWLTDAQRGQRHGGPGRGGLRRGERARRRRATAPGRGRCGADRSRSPRWRWSAAVPDSAGSVAGLRLVGVVGRPRTGRGSSSALPNWWVLTKSRVSSYIRAMYFSSSLASTRHWPRPPILIAGRSPLRTSA